MANTFFIESEALSQAKTYAAQASKECSAYYKRMNTILNDLYDAVDGIDSARADGWSTGAETAKTNLNKRKSACKKQAARMDNFCDMVQIAIDDGENCTESLKKESNALMYTLGKVGSVGDVLKGDASQHNLETLNASKSVSVSNAALGSAFMFTASAAFLSLNKIQNWWENFYKSTSKQVYEAVTEIVDKYMTLTPYTDSKVNWSPTYGGKANSYSDYKVIKGFDPDFVLYQRNYHNGSIACTASCDAMVKSIMTGEKTIPTKDYWKGDSCTWPNTTKLKGSTEMTVSQQCETIYQYVTEGKPVVMRVTGHSVLAVGIRDGAQAGNITPADILVADPGDGKIKTAAEIYSGWYENTTNLKMTNNQAFGLRVPTE